MRQLLESGVHFGHQTKRWNPKMRPFIYGARNGIYIIDLQKTVRLFREAYDAIVHAVGRGGEVLFVATKEQAKDVMCEEAKRVGMPYVVNRWLGGTLTNFKTIQSSVARLKMLEKLVGDEQLRAGHTKKELSGIDKEIEKLLFNFEGIRNMEKLPGVVFVIDTIKESIAVHEANRLGIPVVAVVDTNCDPGPIDYLVPGNDDSIRAIKLYASSVAEACLEGARQRDEHITARDRAGAGEKVVAAAAEATQAAAKPAPAFPGAGPEVIVKRPRGYFARGAAGEEDDEEFKAGRKRPEVAAVAPAADGTTTPAADVATAEPNAAPADV
jgi:small subunit ribosomal protein S2